MTIDVREELALFGGEPVRERFLVFGEPYIGDEEIEEVVATLKSAWLGTGPKVRRLEADFCAYSGAKHAVAVSSCTAGLHLALDVLGVGPGDEVITTPMTFAATGNVILHQRATPVFADIDATTLNIDPAEIESHITPRTKAIIPVHMAGRPCDMDAILGMASDRGIHVIGDCAHAVETRFHHQPVATLGSFSVFSFYANKNMTTAEGGLITTADPAWADDLRVRSLHGLSRDAWKRYSAEGFQPYETLYPGYKYNLTDLQASLGLHQLARIEDNLRIRERHWRAYRSAFQGLPGIILPAEDPDPTNRHARHLFIILLNLEELAIERDQFIAALRAENIGAGVHYSALHLHKYYRDTFGFRRGDYPNAEWVGERTVSLPLTPKLTDEDVCDVIEAVRKIAHFSRR
jgi:dTDP-4-amino-4,6-dideoxygalactose transaminase